MVAMYIIQVSIHCSENSVITQQQLAMMTECTILHELVDCLLRPLSTLRPFRDLPSSCLGDRSAHAWRWVHLPTSLLSANRSSLMVSPPAAAQQIPASAAWCWPTAGSQMQLPIASHRRLPPVLESSGKASAAWRAATAQVV